MNTVKEVRINDPQAVRVQNKVIYSEDGVAYADEVTKKLPKHNMRDRGRVLCSQYVPKVHVDDGSNGVNLVNTYSYPNYNDNNAPPNITNNYHNNYKSSYISNPVYTSTDGCKLHPTSDSGGYSNFTISMFKK